MFRFKFLDKIKTQLMVDREVGIANGTIEPGPLERGARIDDGITRYLTLKSDTLPPEVKPATAQRLKWARKEPTTKVQLDLGFTSDWIPCSTTDWNRCWWRAKIDLQWQQEPGVLVNIDNKSGKFDVRKAADYDEQLETYGLASLLTDLSAEIVYSQLWYSDLGVVYPADDNVHVMERAQISEVQQKYLKRITPMFNDTRFAPRPSDSACRFCDFSKSKGGPCKF